LTVDPLAGALSFGLDGIVGVGLQADRKMANKNKIMV
jgi:hypothetical protein